MNNAVYRDRVFNNEQGERMLRYMAHQTALLETMAMEKIEALTEDIFGIRALVRDGLAPEMLPVGEYLNIPWTDLAAGREYTARHDIVHYETVEYEDGELANGMFLQWHHASPFGIPFGQYQALWTNIGSAISGGAALPAGTYTFVFDAAYGAAVANEIVKFTTTQDIPVGGKIAGLQRFNDIQKSAWRLTTYDENYEVIETVVLEDADSAGDGPSLGTIMLDAINGELNALRVVAYGENYWPTSTIRQFLNSTAGVGLWWSAQHKFDMPPAEAKTKAGWLSGYSEEFLECIVPVKVVTVSNTVGRDGAAVVTYDRVFLPSLEQIYCTPQVAGAEGSAWEYWKRALGLETPALVGSSHVYEAYKSYAIENKASAVHVRLRSAYRGYVFSTWCVSAAGCVNGSYACGAYRFEPACVISEIGQSPVDTSTGDGND